PRKGVDRTGRGRTRRRQGPVAAQGRRRRRRHGRGGPRPPHRHTPAGRGPPVVQSPGHRRPLRPRTHLAAHRPRHPRHRRRVRRAPGAVHSEGASMSIHYEDDQVRLFHGDCLEVMRTLPDASVDAIVTDPPYGLGFMGREWDALPPGEPWARECLRVLKPGGHLLAFGGSRTWHRLAVAVEDAGFEIRDSIAWLYGNGFPKSLDVSKAIDKAAGAKRGRYERAAFGATCSDDEGTTYGTALGSTPLTPDAERWQGWGTALKPSFEPVVCARKPL